MGFKEDADFARYLTMGARAAKSVADDLAKHGHRVIELERHAMGNKVWSIKVKRLRLPDLLCVRCGIRFESKGKSRLELKLSHSEQSGREWHGGGMRGRDIFAFIRVELSGGSAETGHPVYVTRSALHDAAESLQIGSRKAFAAGSESDVKWPAWAPSYSGIVTDIRAGSRSELGAQEVIFSVCKDGGRRGSYRAKWPSVHAYLNVGENFSKGDIVAGSVAPAQVDCAGNTWHWQNDLTSECQDDKYAAIKAAVLSGDGTDQAILSALAKDDLEDWRVQLEAIGVLAARGSDQWTGRLAKRTLSSDASEQEQMEGTFILSEIRSAAAARALAEIAEPEASRNPEVRAAAVWGLGLGAYPQPNLVARFLDDDADLVALHAAAALPSTLSPAIVKHLLGWLQAGQPRQAAMAAHVLARRGLIEELIGVACDISSTGRFFAIRMLGDFTAEQIEQSASVPLALRQLLQPIWAQHDDWLRSPAYLDALPALEMQRIRL